jgi:hypothetical protein
MVHWRGEHALLDAGDQKQRFERALQRMGYNPSAFCVKITAVSRGPTRNALRYMVHISLVGQNPDVDGVELEGGHGRGWIPTFAQLAQDVFPVAIAAEAAVRVNKRLALVGGLRPL